MAPILSAIEKRIAVVKNAIAIIVVYFLFVIIIVSGHLTCDFFFHSAKIGHISQVSKLFLHILIIT